MSSQVESVQHLVDGTALDQWLRTEFRYRVAVPLDIAQLRSIASSLEELAERMARIRKDGDSEEEIMVDLIEVERQLSTASRRLNKSLRGQDRRT